mgnify:CR=1 FL=1
MGKGRFEAFSDGVLAIIITIMVLELKVPHGDTLGALAEIYPMDFPFGEGSDLAGEVVADAEGFAAGEAVFGWSDERAAHAEYVAVPATQLARIRCGNCIQSSGAPLGYVPMFQ